MRQAASSSEGVGKVGGGQLERQQGICRSFMHEAARGKRLERKGDRACNRQQRGSRGGEVASEAVSIGIQGQSSSPHSH